MSLNDEVTVIVEVGFSSVSTEAYLILDDTLKGKLDTALLGDTDTWVDLSDKDMSWSTRVGSTRVDGPVLRYEAGTATTLFNNSDRDLDPTNLAGPYVAAGETQVEPMRPVRFRATYSGTTYPIWHGFADSWKITYEGETWSSVVLTATDAFQVFESYDRSASGSVGASEDTGARIDRILDSIGWPAEFRDIAVGDTTLQATDLSGVALSELQLAAETEAGEFYIGPDGDAVFRNRLAMLTETRSNTSQATFGDGGGAELPYQSVDLEYDNRIYNLVRITREGGSEQTAQDASSQSAYLTHVYSRTGLLMEDDATASSYAGFVLHMGKNPELRFARLKLFPLRDPDLWPQVLGRQIGDRITVIRRPPGGGDPIERDVFIRGIEHSVTPGQWDTTFVLQSATAWSFLTLDNADLGVLDSNALAF